MLAGMPGAHGSGWRGPCSGPDYPVLVYDAANRKGYVGSRETILRYPDDLGIRLPKLISSGELQPDFFKSKFLCDGRPVEVYVVNRRIKQVYTAALNGVFTMPNNVISIRGITSGLSQPAASATQAAGAGIPQAKGSASTTTPIQTDQAVEALLRQETFDQPDQTLVEERQQLLSAAHQLYAQLDQYSARVRHLNDPLVAGRTQGSVTLPGTRDLFREMAGQIRDEFLDSGSPHFNRPDELDFEVKFDLVVTRLNLMLQDLPRLNSSMSFPFVDQLASLQSQLESFEAQKRQYRNDIMNTKTAVQILLSSSDGGTEFVAERRKAEMRKMLLSFFPANSTPNMDPPTIAKIVELYGGAQSPPPGWKDSLKNLDQKLKTYNAEVEPTPADEGKCDLPACDSLLRPGRMRAFFESARSGLFELRHIIDDVNLELAATLDAINRVYLTTRIPRPSVANLDLQGKSGNLTVYYSMTGAEPFAPYVLTNEAPQLSPSFTPVTQTPPAAPPAAVGGPAASASPPAPVSGAASTTPSSPAGEFQGRFQIHHFDQGTFFGAFAVSSIASRSYSLVAQDTTTPPSSSQITQSSSSPGMAVVAGIDLYAIPKDMYPGAKTTNWDKLGPGLVIGASVYPLQRYYIGLGLEPIRGVTFAGGFVLGEQTRLPSNGPAPNQYYPGGQLSASTLPSASAFRKGAFFMVGFDWNIFQALFSGVTTLGAPPSGSASGVGK
jgi:hypothetical protein